MTGKPAMSRTRSFRYMAGRHGSLFVRLFRVDFTHNYYTQEGGRCSDFTVVPTAATSSILASLGLVFKDEGAGFSIFIQPDSLPNLIAYLRREAIATPTGPQFWSRLSFLMLLDNPSFVGITALPIETRQSETNLYGSNRTAHDDDGVLVLPAGDFMGAESLYPAVGSEVPLSLPADADRVTVSDISGTVVIPAPRDGPVVITDTGKGPLPKRATLDLSTLPHDLYTVQVTAKDGKPVGAPLYPRDILYVPTGSGSMVLLDLLFTQPTPDSGGTYPIPSLFAADGAAADGPMIGKDGAYRLPFDARQTRWQYFVVSQSPLSQLDPIQIKGPGTRFIRADEPVMLPDGREAILFTSEKLLPLRQKSAQHFQLDGQRRDASGHENMIHITRLPVAPGAPVWPGQKGQSTTGTSEIFVYV